MLIDDVQIKVQAGHGGRGAVAFDRNKGALGPCGGNGGRGGSVILEGVSNLAALEHFRFTKDLAAGDGKEGHGQFVDGPDGEDLILKVPVGTVVHNLDTKNEAEVTEVGQQLMVARGGAGGKGNYKFRSPHNTSPKEFQPGLPGEEFNLRLELKLIADVGFVGLPNVGKSTLLNLLTRAKAKVANYQFTTLEPNLGVYYGLILADIPGLIEGASTGRGLGLKFLRHIERTKILFHFLAADSDDPLADYQTVKQELKTYNPALADKPEYIILTKIDNLTSPVLAEKIAKLQTLGKTTMAISCYDDQSLGTIKELLNQLEQEKLKSTTTS